MPVRGVKDVPEGRNAAGCLRDVRSVDRRWVKKRKGSQCA